VGEKKLTEQGRTGRSAALLKWGISGRIEIYVSCLILVFAVLLVTYKLFGPGLPCGTDMFAHLFWVQSFWKSFQSLAYPTWSPLWYGGYQIMLTYAPFSHIFSALISLPLQDYVLGTKIAIFLSFLIAAWATYFVCREFDLSSCAGVVAGVAYTFAYHRIIHNSVRGSLSTSVAIGFLPLFFLFVVRLFNSLNKRDTPATLQNILFSSLTLMFVFLSHLLVGLCAIILLMVYTLYHVLYNLFIRHWSNVWEEEIAHKRSEFFRLVSAFLVVLILFFMFASFWFIPALSYLEITGMSSSVEVIAAESNFPGWPETVPSFFANILTRQFDWYPWYIGISVFFFAIFGAIYKMKRFPTNFLSIFFLVSIFLASGGISPIQALHLPFVNSLTWFRLFVLVVFSVSLLTGVFTQAVLDFSRKRFKQANMKKIFSLSLAVLLVSIIYLDFSPGFGRFTTSETSPVLQVEFDWLSEKNGTFRVFSEGVYSIQGSMERYGPAIHGKPLLHGNDEGSITLETFRSTGELIWMLEEASTNNVVSARLVDGLTRKFRFGCVKYFVAGRGVLMEVGDVLDSSSVFTCHKIDPSLYVYEFNEPVRLVRPVSKILVVGDENSAAVVNDLLFCAPLDFVYDIIDPADVDSIAASLLSSYDLVIVYGLGSDESNVLLEGVLEEYLRQGGNALIDTSTLGRNYNFLGVQCIVTSIHDNVSVTVNPEYPELSMVPHDNFSPAEYYGGQWDFHTYSGLDDTIATINNNYTLLGYRNVGMGKAYFLGFNLFYHMDAFGNEQERRFLNAIVDLFLEEGDVEVSSVNFEAERLTFTADVSGSNVTLLVSNSYFPTWKAYDNGEEIELSQSYDGWMLIDLGNGVHQIEIKHELTTPYILGFSISICTVVMTATLLIISKHKPTFFKRLKEVVKQR
jgi:hypothetical protein